MSSFVKSLLSEVSPFGVFVAVKLDILLYVGPGGGCCRGIVSELLIISVQMSRTNQTTGRRGDTPHHITSHTVLDIISVEILLLERLLTNRAIIELSTIVIVLVSGECIVGRLPPQALRHVYHVVLLRVWRGVACARACAEIEIPGGILSTATPGERATLGYPGCPVDPPEGRRCLHWQPGVI